PLVVVARTATCCREGADGCVHAVDLDAGRPGRATVRGLAEVDGAVRGGEPRPRDVDVVSLRAAGVRVGDDELLVVKDRRIVVVCDDPEWHVTVRLERLDRRRVIEGATDRRVRRRNDDRVRRGGDVEDDPGDVRVAP